MTSVIFFFFLLASAVGLLVGNLKSAPRPSVVPPRAFARLTRPRPAPTPNAFLQEIHGNRWALVAAELPGKTGQQCAQRWRHKVNPNIKKEKWSAEEDAQVRRDERPARAKARLAPARARRERERPAPEPRAAHPETRSVEMHARGPPTPAARRPDGKNNDATWRAVGSGDWSDRFDPSLSHVRCSQCPGGLEKKRPDICRASEAPSRLVFLPPSDP